MEAKDFLEEIDYYNTNVDGEQFEDLEIYTLADMLEVYHQRKLKLLGIFGVSQQRELLLAYHKHLDSFNDPTIYNASESMIDDYLANNCG